MASADAEELSHVLGLPAEAEGGSGRMGPSLNRRCRPEFFSWRVHIKR